MDIANEIKERLPAKEVFQHYGLCINSSGFCKSPFSVSDNTPSLKVYDGNRGWYDFSSNRGGDVIDFVAQYFGIDFQTACKKLNNDFSLGLPISDDADREALREANRAAYLRRKEADRRKKHRESLQNAYDRALTKFAELDALAEKGRTAASLDDLTDDVVYAMQNVQQAAYELSQAEAELYNFTHETA